MTKESHLKCPRCGSLNVSQEILEDTARRLKRIIEYHDCERLSRPYVTLQVINHPEKAM
ncbi:hypothetical protein PT277_01700 [Acetobacteraceae bacterium ESL0709]|nr:hypothetical protein [Acetobacteraceae bacterium ESL0697]MDF7677416.1 hypothetical protein [Acetobacteraceae bacterium ESL0709]